MATFYQTDREDGPAISYFTELVEKESILMLRRFKKALSSYMLFHLAFNLFLLLQVVASSLILLTLPKSPLFAFSLAGIILTLFSYLIIIYYFQGKKSEQLQEIKQSFFLTCKKQIPFTEGEFDYHFALAGQTFQLITLLGRKEAYCLSLPPFTFCQDFMIKFSFWLHLPSIQLMQEILIDSSIDEQLALIKEEPLSPAAHASLASTYLTLARIYQKPTDPLFAHSYLIDKLYEKPLMQERFHQASTRALEELKVLDDLSQNDPWVHAQLASCYHLLGLKEEELREYEMLLHLSPDDKEILLRTGILYFKLGRTAKALRIYHTLKQIDTPTATALIAHYL